MKRFSLVFLSLSIFVAIFATGCLDSSTDKPIRVGATLVEGHSGWGQINCATCHHSSTLVRTQAGKDAHSSFFKDGLLSADAFDVCTACHGSNGVTNVELAGCATCHKAGSDMADIVNPRFAISHPVALSDKTCNTCHDTTGHTSPVTKLNVAFSTECMVCHNGTHKVNGKVFNIAGHYGTDCSSCHTTNYEFVRKADKPEVILKHNVVSTGGGDCIDCHKAGSNIATIVNPRFLRTHLSVSSGIDCTTCHDLTGHANPVTKLKVLSTNSCLTCHSNYKSLAIPEHSESSHDGFACYECHTAARNKMEFVRSPANTKDILKHSVLPSSCDACHD